MRNEKQAYRSPAFSHIYVEKKIRSLARTKEILAKFPAAEIIEIGHYKDVFCRKGQSYPLQHRAQNLILAAKEGTLIYPGAPVCQNFGNESFYYTSCVMNCVYDCSYCYLKGMYPSANIVIFVNLEDFFAETEKRLAQGPLYLCVSYDTDLLALEAAAGYAAQWHQFAQGHEDKLTIEIRTKCANPSYFRNRKPSDSVIYAFTLSPQAAAEAFERHAPSLARRISCAAEAVRLGFLVRLCFDPMLYIDRWQEHYSRMLADVCSMLAMEKLKDVSVGTFRISQDYLKKMRKQEPDCAAAWFPYENDHGFYHYPKELMERMEQFLTERLMEALPKEKIFLWKEAGQPTPF